MNKLIARVVVETMPPQCIPIADAVVIALAFLASEGWIAAQIKNRRDILVSDGIGWFDGAPDASGALLFQGFVSPVLLSVCNQHNTSGN